MKRQYEGLHFSPTKKPHINESERVHLTWKEVSSLLKGAYSINTVASALNMAPERLRTNGIDMPIEYILNAERLCCFIEQENTQQQSAKLCYQ